MKKTIFSVGALCLVLAGCGGHGSMTPGVVSGPPGGVTPKVLQTGNKPVAWTQFQWGDTLANPHQLDWATVGPDKNTWYTDYNGQALTRMTMGGVPHAFPLIYNGTTHYYPGGVAAGKDGKFYVGSTNLSANLAIVTTAGALTLKPIPSGDSTYDGGFVLGPDGNVWFTEQQHVAKITTAGTITEFVYNDGNTGNSYGGITVGPDGDIWASESNTQVVDDIEPTTGAMTSYYVGCNPQGIVSAIDGNLYSFCSSSLIRITPSGSYTLIPTAFTTDGYPSSITRGPDGNPWFTISGSNMIVRYNTATNALNVFFPPTAYSSDYALTGGSDGNIWALDTSGHTDVYILHVISAAPATLTFTGLGQNKNFVVTEKGTTAWTATTTNPAIATVTQGSPADTFVVHSVGAGTCKITATDAINNQFQVKVTVP